jgi:hypothetical protein
MRVLTSQTYVCTYLQGKLEKMAAGIAGACIVTDAQSPAAPTTVGAPPFHAEAMLSTATAALDGHQVYFELQPLALVQNALPAPIGTESKSKVNKLVIFKSLET